MAKTTIAQAIEPCNEDFLRFIIIPPELAMKLLNAEQSDLLDSIPLREKGKKYSNTSEDKWATDDSGYCAEVSYFFDCDPKYLIVHVPHNGRMYHLENSTQIAEVVSYLQANEAKKIVK